MSIDPRDPWMSALVATLLLGVTTMGCGATPEPAGGGGSTGTGGGASSATGGATGSGGAGTAGASGGAAGGATGTTSAGGAAGRGTGGIAGAGGVTTGTGGRGGTTGAGGATGSGGAGGGGIAGITCTPQTWDTAPIGWATLSGGTTGGGAGNPITITNLTQFNQLAGGPGPVVIQVSGKIAGIVNVGSNKTILGLCGAELDGSLNLTGSTNVIVRNLKIVGFNCTDSPADCSAGNDAVHIDLEAHNLWFDHLDISDGSDGNLDVSHGSDFVTVSWTKFHYSGKRSDPVAGSNGHRFSDLIGHDDTNGAEDTGHLNVTFHHVWWADNVNQRMPRVRFGKVHVFNSLYTAAGDSACIELGVSANIRSENNAFVGVTNTVDSTHSNSASIVQSIGNLGSAINIGAAAFKPTYVYTLDAVASVSAAVMAGAGPH